MGLLDGLKGALSSVLGQAEQQVLPQLLSQALAGTSLGSLQGLLDQLRTAGLGQQVSSWLGSGPNEPVTAAQLEAALGDDIVARISSRLNMPPDQIFGFLAAHLPALIDRISPNGVLEHS